MLLPNTLFWFSFFNRWPENNHLFIITIYEDFFAAGILFFSLRALSEDAERRNQPLFFSSTSGREPSLPPYLNGRSISTLVCTGPAVVHK